MEAVLVVRPIQGRPLPIFLDSAIFRAGSGWAKELWETIAVAPIYAAVPLLALSTEGGSS